MEIETIDSFQGRQKDVIILSCVRASSGSSVGFVADVRRMNVAITRAKRALWVLGNLSTLQANATWAALIQYVALVHRNTLLSLSTGTHIAVAWSCSRPMQRGSFPGSCRARRCPRGADMLMVQ